VVNPEAILYRTHRYNPVIARELARLLAEVGSRYDIFAVGYCRAPGALAGIDNVPAKEYSREDLAALGYARKIGDIDWDNVVGQSDLPVMKFFREHGNYDYYWIIEYDVRFSGPWARIFSDLALSSADILCTTIQTYGENPNWHHWHSLIAPGATVPPERWIKGFMPFCRVSQGALAAIDAAYRNGWGGHSEGTWPTIVREAGLSIEDIGGRGSFVPSHRRGKYYFNSPDRWSLFPGTFVWRPVFLDDALFGSTDNPIIPGGNMLWHPVK